MLMSGRAERQGAVRLIVAAAALLVAIPVAVVFGVKALTTPGDRGPVMAAGWLPPGVDKDEFSFDWSARRGFVSYGNANANSEQVNSVSLFIAKSEQDILSMDGPLPDKKGGKWVTVGGQLALVRFGHWTDRDGPDTLTCLVTWQQPGGLWSGALAHATIDTHGFANRVSRKQLRAYALRVAAEARYPADVGAAPLPPIRYAFNVGHLPQRVRSKVRIIGGNLSGDQVAWSSGFWLSLDGSLTENILPPATAGAEAQRKADNRNRLRITVRRNPADAPVSRDISVNGAPASWLGESELSVWLGDGMTAYVEGDFPSAELIAIAGGLRAVPHPEDRANWTAKPLG
jgi:hypothetical protein